MQWELLAIALELASRENGHPGWVSRSRAISTAYYALFHALAELCGCQLVGDWTPWPAFRHVYRSLDHSNAKLVFKDFRRGGGPSETLIALGESFSQLQEERHKADYDPGYRASRAETLGWIERSRQAINSIGALNSEERKLLAARLIGRTRPR